MRPTKSDFARQKRFFFVQFSVISFGAVFSGFFLPKLSRGEICVANAYPLPILLIWAVIFVQKVEFKILVICDLAANTLLTLLTPNAKKPKSN